MNDAPRLLKPTRPAVSQSPTRQKHARLTDDLLSHLEPHTAVDALTTATGSLKACLDGASAPERDFAMRAAVASKRIWVWLGELEEWKWPRNGGSAGFEGRGGKRRKLDVVSETPAEDDLQNGDAKGDDSGAETDSEHQVGSLTLGDIERYEWRVNDIQREIRRLEMDEMKSHVLTNHIMPLSRPGTPMSDSHRSVASVSSYNRMDDMTAVVTAIIVQALPNLAKLSRLLHVWSMRLIVLQGVSDLLMAMRDAEVALRSGWNAISKPAAKPSDQHAEAGGDSATREEQQVPGLTRDDFEVMRGVLQRRVSKPARRIDYMLDCLEGLSDTLPDSWLDRMDAVELGFGEWMASCDRKLRESEWVGGVRRKPASLETSERDDQPRNGHTVESEDHSADRRNGVVTLPVPQSTGDVEEPSKERRDATTSSGDIQHQQDHVAKSHDDEQQGTEVQPSLSFDGTASDDAAEVASITSQPPLPALSVEQGDYAGTPEKGHSKPAWEMSDDICSPYDATGPTDREEEPDLPPLWDGSRQTSLASQTSTVVHGASSHFGGLSSDLPEVSVSPAIHRDRIREAQYVEASPPSSPPLVVSDQKGESSFVAAPRSPSIEPIPENDDDSVLGKVPEESSYLDDYDDSFSVSEYTGPSERRDSVGDARLRQQISDIIESIPAKIKLSTETPAVNLNPPDLQLPRIRKRPSKEAVKRSASSLSTASRATSRATSRAATPSFTLSPAKNSRARHMRSQQEIKVYHLSRSTGEAPIKLLIRCVGENGERVMVRVGGGWADLSEYLKEYASHHGRRKDKAKVEVRDLPRVASGRGPTAGIQAVAAAIGSSPPSRPPSVLDTAPATPLNVRKTRRSVGASASEAPRLSPLPQTPAAANSSLVTDDMAPSEGFSTRSRSSSHLSWAEEDSSFLGLAGPSGKKVEMSEENKAWVESVKEKVRVASTDRKISGPPTSTPATSADAISKFGEIGKVGGTKRLFRRTEERSLAKK